MEEQNEVIPLGAMVPVLFPSRLPNYSSICPCIFQLAHADEPIFGRSSITIPFAYYRLFASWNQVSTVCILC